MDKLIQDQPLQVADEEIISKILSGEHRLYEVIIRRYNPRLFRIGMSMVKNDAEVEELMQIAFIKAYENLRQFENKSRFGTWLTRIMINECLGYIDKSKRRAHMEKHNELYLSGKAAENPAGKLLSKELGTILENALQQLPEKYRLVFVLREMEDMSIAETTEALNITEANVKVRLNRAKSMLRDTLGSYYRNDSIYHFHLVRCDRIVNNVFKSLGIRKDQNHSA
jgi:RNA polymerase sigma factor (sigma-70 family)